MKLKELLDITVASSYVWFIHNGTESYGPAYRLRIRASQEALEKEVASQAAMIDENGRAALSVTLVGDEYAEV